VARTKKVAKYKGQFLVTSMVELELAGETIEAATQDAKTVKREHLVETFGELIDGDMKLAGVVAADAFDKLYLHE
jgi:hypothetical protein